MVLILFNTMFRAELMYETMRKNLNNSGVKDYFVYATNNGGDYETSKNLIKLIPEINDGIIRILGHNSGNPASLNYMLHEMRGRDWEYFCVLGDDLLLPDNWLRDAIDKHEQLKRTRQKPGICSFHPFKDWEGTFDHHLGIYTKHDGVYFSDWVISRDVFEAIGYFVAVSNYGLWDRNYCERAHSEGFLNFALKNYMTKHKGHDVGENTEYRKMKDKQLKLAGERISIHKRVFTETYLPYEKTTWEAVEKVLSKDINGHELKA